MGPGTVLTSYWKIMGYGETRKGVGEHVVLRSGNALVVIVMVIATI
jgi:hypothetical protein